MTMPTRPIDEPPDNAIAVVQAWHDALNSGDLNRLMTLMHDDIAFGGPRGEGRGAALVRD